MKLYKLYIMFVLVLAMVTQSQMGYGQTESRYDNPDWTIDTFWTMNAPVASGKTVQDAILNHNSDILFTLSIEDSLVISSGKTLSTTEAITVLPGGQLHIWGKVMLMDKSIKLLPGGIIHIYDGGQLAGMADVELKALSGVFIIDEGGSMFWTGDWKNNGGSGTTMTINGTVEIEGDLDNKIDIEGDGSIMVYGTLNNFPNASIFGCELPGDACCMGVVPCALPAEDPLSVELLSFDVKLVTDRVLIAWTTTSELYNDCFIIERSIDTKNWKEIAEVIGINNASGLAEYEIWDTSPAYGLSYYRLMQKDMEGNISSLGIEAITCSMPKPYFNIFPNPAREMVVITLGNFESAKISILDYTGRLVDGTEIQYERFEIDVSAYPAGLYFVELRSGETIQTRKLIVH